MRVVIRQAATFSLFFFSSSALLSSLSPPPPWLGFSSQAFLNGPQGIFYVIEPIGMLLHNPSFVHLAPA